MNQYMPAGSKVRKGATQAYSKLIGAASIFAITPCTEQAALAAVEEMQARPLTLIDLPPTAAKALVAGADIGDPIDGSEDDLNDDEERPF
jgi:hypothetical protein